MRKVRQEMVSAFQKHGVKRVKAHLGYQGENKDVGLLWAVDLGIWYAPEVIPGSRYWNAFGTKEPLGSSVPITCEVNLPLHGIDRRIGGAAASDEQGHAILVHRGRIGGGRKGIGAELFWSHYEGEWLTVWDGDRNTDVAAVAELSSPRFARQIQFFVHEVERIKALVSDRQQNGKPARRGGSRTENTFEIKDLGDEFAGTKTYAVSRKVSAVCDHGPIVKKLRKLLGDGGYSTGKDAFRDLYVHRDRKVTSLFEVKPSTDRQGIYSAVGQLLLHSAELTPQPQLFSWLPIRTERGMGAIRRRIESAASRHVHRRRSRTTHPQLFRSQPGRSAATCFQARRVSRRLVCAPPSGDLRRHDKRCEALCGVEDYRRR